MFYLLILPAFVLSEGIYLVKHPKTFNGLAALIWLVITGTSFFFIGKGWKFGLVPVIHVIGIAVYYFVKLRRPKKRRSDN
jgi:hypothetical protein